MKDIDFLEFGDNIYTTAKYIVAQKFSIIKDSNGNKIKIVYDYFYVRTEERDKNYSKLFLKDIRVTGGRISCPISKRYYIN